MVAMDGEGGWIHGGEVAQFAISHFSFFRLLEAKSRSAGAGV